MIKKIRQRKKRHVSVIANFLTETLQIRRQENDIFKVLEEKKKPVDLKLRIIIF